MTNIKRFSINLSVSLIALLTLATTPAFAHKLAGSASGDDNASADHSTVETDHATTNTASDDSSHSELRKKADDHLSDMRKDRKSQLTATERQNRCEDHKNGLNTKFDRIVRNSKKIQARIDEIFTKTKAYQQSSRLNPADYDSLVASATTAQSDSQASISALEALKPTLDCTSATVASDIATFKEAAKTARDNLKTYRTDVKAVIKALKDAQPTTQEAN